MFRWIAVLAAVVLAIGAAYGQSSQTQPTLPLGQAPMMGGHMNAPMMDGNAATEPGMMHMMQMMHMMESGMMGPGMMDQDMGGPMCQVQMAMMHMAGMQGSPASHLEARLAFAKAELAITPAQDEAWQVYAAALRKQAPPMSAEHHGTMEGAAFPATFDARIMMLEDRLASLKAIRDAAVGLYAKLDGAQKKRADTLLPMSRCL